MNRSVDETDDLGARLEGMRGRLRRMVQVRMHPRLHDRLDASDVLQEAFLEVSKRLPEYNRSGQLPFYLWVRRITGDKLFDLHRHHLGAQKRDARREVRPAAAEVNTISLSQVLLDQGPTPSAVGSRNEQLELLRTALDAMDRDQREALTLRHFEGVTNAEVAQVLGVSEATASRCYMRALEGVRAFLEHHDR